MGLKDDGSVSSETTLGEASVRSVDLLLNISTQHATTSKLSKSLPSAIQNSKNKSLESNVSKQAVKNYVQGTNVVMNNESDQIAGNNICSQSTTFTISPSTRMLNELSQASRAAGNANNGQLDGAGDLMFDMSQLSQLEPIRGLELESCVGRYELDSSKGSNRNVGNKRKAGDMTLSGSLGVKKTKNAAKASARDAEREIPYSFHIVTFSKKSPFGINVKDESTIGAPSGTDELRLKIIEIHPDCERAKHVKPGDVLFHLPPGCNNDVQLNLWITKYMQSHFRAIDTSYRTESFGLEAIKLDDLILMSKSQSRPTSFVVMRDKAQEEFPTHCTESKYLQCSLNDEELKNIMKHENYPIIPCCRKCKSDKGHHHKLCPRHRDFRNSGSKHKLEYYAAGAFYKCQACIFWIENGRPNKEEKHNYACTVYSASPVPTTKGAENTKRSNKKSTKKGKSSKPKVSKGTEKKISPKKVSAKKKKEVVSKDTTSNSCDSEKAKSPEKEDTKSKKAIKSLQKSDSMSYPKEESSKLSHSDCDNPESSQNCNKENDDNTNKIETLCITDDNRFSKWVKCPNPWGDREFKDSDLVLFSPETYISYHEIYGSSPKRFNREPFKDTNYRQSHKSQKEGGLSVLVLKRDRLALRSWGFRFCHHDFGACLITCVEPMSPADAAVSLDCEFEKNSLSVDDMILAVDNKRVGGMTVVELEILLETAGSEITLVVSRSRLRNKENLAKVSSFEFLNSNQLHWMDFGASENSQKIVSTNNEKTRSSSEEDSSSHQESPGKIPKVRAIRDKLLSLEFKDIPRDIVPIPSKKKGSKVKYAYVHEDKNGTKWRPSVFVLGKTMNFRTFESEEDAGRMGAWIYASLQILKGDRNAINKTEKMAEQCNYRDDKMANEKETSFVSKPKNKVTPREKLLSLEFKDIPRDIVAIPSKKKGSKCHFSYITMDISGKSWRPNMNILGKSTTFRSHDSEEDAGRMAAWIYESLQNLKKDPNAVIRKETTTSKSSEVFAEKAEQRDCFTTEKDSSSSTIVTNSNAPNSVSMIRENTMVEEKEDSRNIGDKSFRSSPGEDIDESLSESTSSVEGASVEPEWDDDSNPWLGCVCGQTHGSPIPVFWLQCDACDAWYNVASQCVGFDEAQVNSTNYWSCPDCTDADSQLQNQTKDIEIRVGSVVNVEDRTWSGSNKPGGVARITNITSDSAGTTRYDVKYVLESRSEKDIDQKYVTINCNMAGQSFFSPERSTRSR